MLFHEKSLELNITHELLNLADSWYWFLIDVPLWRYWRPAYRLPFLPFPKSTAGGLHINYEGHNDPHGDAGGGFDVRIKSGIGSHLLFIQYKKGDYVLYSPGANSIFDAEPHDHFKFEINSVNTNQHFLLRNLAQGIGAVQGNAVVYAFPLIADMNEMEANTGRLIRKTKFISINDLDQQAAINNVAFVRGQTHYFRIGKDNMDRCEVNFFFFFFQGRDRSSEILADIIGLRFQKILTEYVNSIKKNYPSFGLPVEIIGRNLRFSFIEYLRYILHYFEVSLDKLNSSFLNQYPLNSYPDEFNEYSNLPKDVADVRAVLLALGTFEEYFNSLSNSPELLLSLPVPLYEPGFLFSIPKDELKITFDKQDSAEVLEDLTYLVL